jgi:hypothetical protein
VRVKLAFTERAIDIGTTHVPVPVQPSPVQPSNTEPDAAVGVSVTDVPWTNEPEHAVPQSIPAGDDVTLPPAGRISTSGCRSSDTDSVYCGGGGAAGGSSGAGGGEPGSVVGGAGEGGAPEPGGGRPGVDGVDDGTDADPRLNVIVPLGSTHLIRQDPARLPKRAST